MSFKLNITYLSDTGKLRTKNEDSALADNTIGLAIVADGMGGHSSGEVASSLAAKVTRDKFDSMRLSGLRPTPYKDELSLETNQLGFAVQLANSVVYEAGNAVPENKGMGTTLSALLLNGDKISIAHIGDSRIYVFRDGVLQQITEDHSLVMEHVRQGILSLEQAEKSPLQNILTRALGTQKAPVIDMKEITIYDGDRLMLCTDGLFKAVPAQDITTILKNTTEDKKACELLVQAANNNGGPDNITVILGTIRKKKLKDSLRDILKK